MTTAEKYNQIMALAKELDCEELINYEEYRYVVPYEPIHTCETKDDYEWRKNNLLSTNIDLRWFGHRQSSYLTKIQEIGLGKPKEQQLNHYENDKKSNR